MTPKGKINFLLTWDLGTTSEGTGRVPNIHKTLKYLFIKSKLLVAFGRNKLSIYNRCQIKNIAQSYNVIIHIEFINFFFSL